MEAEKVPGDCGGQEGSRKLQRFKRFLTVVEAQRFLVAVKVQKVPGSCKEAGRSVGRSAATELVGNWAWLLSAGSSAAVFTAFVCCSLSSRRCVCACVSACLSVCVCVLCVFAVPPRGPAEDWEFSVSVRRRILAAAALLILSLLILCCCSEGSKKIEALAVAAGT